MAVERVSAIVQPRVAQQHTEAAQHVDDRSVADAREAGAHWQDFAAEYAETLGRGDAAAIAATAPAVAGISKRTVSALLAASPEST